MQQAVRRDAREAFVNRSGRLAVCVKEFRLTVNGTELATCFFHQKWERSNVPQRNDRIHHDFGTASRHKVIAVAIAPAAMQAGTAAELRAWDGVEITARLGELGELYGLDEVLFIAGKRITLAIGTFLR